MTSLKFKEVYDFVLDNKLYRDPSITVSRLAHNLNMDSGQLKELFSNYCGQDFYCFINELRVFEAKRMLEENTYSGFSVDAIGRMAGFNSKTDFIFNFKERTGRFPTDYKASYRSVF
jgi:transcriptional regulator GlxA family with amidase domain